MMTSGGDNDGNDVDDVPTPMMIRFTMLVTMPMALFGQQLSYLSFKSTQQ